MLSQRDVPPGEWRLHPQVVQMIWLVFERAEVDLFVSEDNSYCPNFHFFSKVLDALANDCPSAHLNFTLIALLPLSSGKSRRMLGLPGGPTQLIQLLWAAPWSIPLRKDFLSQAIGMIWHKLWSLDVCPLNGSLYCSLRG